MNNKKHESEGTVLVKLLIDKATDDSSAIELPATLVRARLVKKKDIASAGNGRYFLTRMGGIVAAGEASLRFKKMKEQSGE